MAKQREFLWRLAEALDRTGNIVAAEEQLKQLLKMPLDNEEQRLEALCFMADIQVTFDGNFAGNAQALLALRREEEELAERNTILAGEVGECAPRRPSNTVSRPAATAARRSQTDALCDAPAGGHADSNMMPLS